METINLNTIRKDITVEASQQTAFEVFTQHMGLWWPASGHTEDCPMVKVGLEPKVGGRWYGWKGNGEERELGKVLAYDPYALFALDWQIDNQLNFDPELHTEVRVEFIAVGPTTTQVKLTHHNVERLGEAGAGINEGWSEIMDIYKNFASNSFHTSITTHLSAAEALQKIARIADWWGVTVEGKAEQQGDPFILRMGPDAWFNMTVTELIPAQKVVWHVDDCYMPWYDDKTEWKGHDLVFELSEVEGQTQLTFTHRGLVAGIACFKDCVPGWTHWITRSLVSYFNTGQGDFKQR